MHHLFTFVFEKTAAEIVTAASRKVSVIRSKIEERGARIQKLRTDYKISDAVLLDIQNQMRAKEKRGETKMSYTSKPQSERGSDEEEEVTIGAGVIENLATERDLLESEKLQVERLELIVRNLKDVLAYTANGTSYVVKPKLSYEELKYLGF